MSHSNDHSLRMMAPKRKRKGREPGSSLEDLLLGEPHFCVRREQAVWRAVILQMLTDALSGSKKKDNRRFKREALIWLNGKSRDFRTVCELAGYDPDYVFQQIDKTVGPQLRNARREMALPQPKPQPPKTMRAKPKVAPAQPVMTMKPTRMSYGFSQSYVMPGQNPASFSLSIPHVGAYKPHKPLYLLLISCCLAPAQWLSCEMGPILVL